MDTPRACSIAAGLALALVCLAAGGCAGPAQRPATELALGVDVGQPFYESKDFVGFDVRGWPISPGLDPSALVLGAVSATDGSGTALAWWPKVSPGWMDGTHFMVYVDASKAADPVTVKGSLTYQGKPYAVEMEWRHKEFTFAGKTEQPWTATSARLRQVAVLDR
jgi:hypothetical protein